MPQGQHSQTIWGIHTFSETHIHSHWVTAPSVSLLFFAPVNPNDTALLKQTQSRNQQPWKTELEWVCVGFAPSDAESTAQRHLFFFLLLSRFTFFPFLLRFLRFFWEAWGLVGPPEGSCWICTTLSMLWLSLRIASGVSYELR